MTAREIDMQISQDKDRGWLHGLAGASAAALPLLPLSTCPACLAAYAGVLSALGLGFVLEERVLAPMIVLFLILTVLGIARSTRSHRNKGPLLATVAGAALVVAFRLVWNEPIALYGGAALIVAASLWNLWLKRPRRQRATAPEASADPSKPFERTTT